MKPDQLAIDNTSSNEWVSTEVLNKLKTTEYKLNLRREATCLYCFQLHAWIQSKDFTMDKYYNFKGILSPDAERVLYAVSVSQGGKDFLIATCNAYLNNISTEIMEILKWNKTSGRRLI